MSAIYRSEALQFLRDLGRQLAVKDDKGITQTDLAAQEYAKKRLWQIAPLPRLGRRGSPTEFRGYEPQHGDTIIAIVEVLCGALAATYSHDAVKALLASDPDLSARSRRNLRAMVHPQNVLRPFDPLHTIGRTLRPLFILRPHFNGQQLTKALSVDLDLLGAETVSGGWSKAWFVGLLATTYLCWRWHDEIPVSDVYPGWYSMQPLQELESRCQYELSKTLPGEDDQLISEDSETLTFTDFGDDWTLWYPRDIHAYPEGDVGSFKATMERTKEKRGVGKLPELAAPPSFEEYSRWIIAALGMYSGGHDPRLEGEDLTSCLVKTTEQDSENSNLHRVVASIQAMTESAIGHRDRILAVVPERPQLDERSSPEWGVMMVALLKEYVREYSRTGSLKERRSLGGRKIARYPIESYSRSGDALSVGKLAKTLTRTMPNFRDFTSRLWMFFIDEPSIARLSHPEEHASHRIAARAVK